MALVINNNLMAANAARNLGTSYGRLATSTQRLSSGLRINSAADDAAGLAIREMMKADISATRQGLRNAADAISMIQTADGALGVIDEKLVRMKELAEQAATGTYTTVQRDIINSEYQAMAREIDRIANATNFNGIKLLDGSVNQQHGGQGLKVHFGVGNNAAEDYYFVGIGDARATSGNGLRVGGDAKNDIWASGGAAGMMGVDGGGCCASGFESLTKTKVFESGDVFSYAYNWDGKSPGDTNNMNGKYTAGLYFVDGGDSLQSLIDKVNAGTQSRIGIQFDSKVSKNSSMSGVAICIGDEAYYISATNNELGATKFSGEFDGTASGLAAKINQSSKTFWAAVDTANSAMVYVFHREGGDNNSLQACDQILGSKATAEQNKSALNAVSFLNVATGEVKSAGTSFSLGGEHWGTMQAIKSKDINGKEVWNAVIHGRDVGAGRDIQIAQPGSGADGNLDTYSQDTLKLTGMTKVNQAKFLSRSSFTQVQDAADGMWKGAEVRTQSSAQEALEALDAAIVKKDKIRADLGAMQNRLENTMTNLEIQAENLQAAESRISDVDVALEMTEFTRNNVLTQAATSMLAQANSMSQLALSLLR